MEDFGQKRSERNWFTEAERSNSKLARRFANMSFKTSLNVRFGLLIAEDHGINLSILVKSGTGALEARKISKTLAIHLLGFKQRKTGSEGAHTKVLVYTTPIPVPGGVVSVVLTSLGSQLAPTILKPVEAN